MVPEPAAHHVATLGRKLDAGALEPIAAQQIVESIRGCALARKQTHGDVLWIATQAQIGALPDARRR